MSVKPDDRMQMRRNINYEYNDESSESNTGNFDPSCINAGGRSKDKGDYCNMNIATFTFGGRQKNELQMQMGSVENEETMINKGRAKGISGAEGKSNKLDRVERGDKADKSKKNEREYYSYNEASVSPLTSLPASPIITNKIGLHNSFLSVVVHSFWNLKVFRNFFLNDFSSLNEKDPKLKLLSELQNVIQKYSQNRRIDLGKLRNSLADLFQNRRKFLVDQPDDPVDCYFAFLNAIHSYSMKNPLNEVSDHMCNNKCISHKYFWIDLCRIDECECKGSSKRFYSNHNYIFDIPLDKLFELSNHINLVEMSKSFKLKSGKFSEVGSTEMSTISDLKGKLFLYFKMLLNQVKVDCPAKGIRCDVNRTNKTFYLANFPNYLAFNLQKAAGAFEKSGPGVSDFAQHSVMETLKTLVMIPKIFDLGIIFDHSSKQKIFFEFFGGICLKPGKTYTCFFKNQETSQRNESEISWIHYDEEKVTTLTSWFDLISICLKNCEFPVLLFYQIQEKYSDSEKELSNEELQTLERYARNADNLVNIVGNRFRSNEDIIKFDSLSMNLVSNKNGNYHTSKTSTSINTSKPNSASSSNPRIDPVTEYSCSYCYTKNRIECPICYKCNRNNEAVIEEILKKRGMNNYINIANFNVNINTGLEIKEKESVASSKGEKERESKASSMRSKRNQPDTNPFIPGDHKEKKPAVNNYVDESSSDEEVIGKRKNYNMPKQISTKKENPVVVKNMNTNTNTVVNTIEHIKTEKAPLVTDNNVHTKTTSKRNVVPSTKPDASPEKLANFRASKKHVTIEEKHSNYDDRIQPFEIIKSKSKKNIVVSNQISNNQSTNPPSQKSSNNNMTGIPDNWICEICTSINKAYEYKCQECKKVNYAQKEALENVVVTGIGVNNPSTKLVKSPIKDDKKGILSVDKKTSDKKAVSVHPGDHAGLKKNCICYTNYNESVIKNNICTICNRYVESIISHENTIKKRYQQETSNRPSLVSHSIITNNLRKQESMNTLQKDKPNEKLKREDSTPHINNKFRSPSSNPTGKPKSVVSNRYKDIYIDNPDEEIVVTTNSNYPNNNPFNHQKQLNRGQDNHVSSIGNNYRSSNVVSNNRLNSTKKKPSEMMSTIAPSSTLGKYRK